MFRYEPNPVEEAYLYHWTFGDGTVSDDVMPSHVYTVSAQTKFEVTLSIGVADLRECKHFISQTLFLHITDKDKVVEIVDIKKTKWETILSSAEVVTVTEPKDREDISYFREFLPVMERLLEGKKGSDDYRDGKLYELVRDGSDRSMKTMVEVIKKSAKTREPDEIEPLNDLVRDVVEMDVKYLTAKPRSDGGEQILDDLIVRVEELTGAGVPVNKDGKMVEIVEAARADTNDAVYLDKLQQLEDAARKL